MIVKKVDKSVITSCEIVVPSWEEGVTSFQEGITSYKDVTTFSLLSSMA